MEFRCRLASPNGEIIEGIYVAESESRLRHEFEEKGLGITVKRKSGEFERALEKLEANYSDYVQKVKEFKPELKWTNIASQHLEIYIKSISERKKSTST